MNGFPSRAILPLGAALCLIAALSMPAKAASGLADPSSGPLGMPPSVAPAATPPVEVAIVARLREPLHDIELHSRAILATGRKPPGIVPFMHAYAALRDRLDTLVSRRDYVGAVAAARRDLATVRKVASKAGLHDFDAEVARCEAILAEPPGDAGPR